MSKGLSSLEHLIGRLQNQTATILNNEKDEEKKRKYEKLAFELMFEDKAIIEKELKDFEYLKSLFSIEWFDKLPTSDKIRVMEIMGMEIKYE